MNKTVLVIFTFFFFQLTFAQFEHKRVYSTFDNLPLPKSDTFNNGADGIGGFTHYGRFFNNSYNDDWGSWSGWALSNMRDDSTAGFMNQYSAVTGHGLSHTPNYMVSTGDGAYIKFDEPTNITGAYFTNSTYAALDMKNGSGFSKKFGGDSGDDEDFFKLIIKSYLSGKRVDSVEFYLADFRFSDNTKDYIVNDWTFVNFTTEISSDGAEMDSISFSYESSDVGEFGVNTPKYFCMDDFNAINDFRVFGNQFRLEEDSFYNGSDGAGGFILDQLFFPNSFNQQWSSWSGWSISTMYDTSTAGFTNQYSSKRMPLAQIPSSNDVIHNQCFISGGAINEIRGPYLAGQEATIFGLFDPPVPVTLFITNTTYAYKDMQDGSQFSKKFGGPSGKDPDFFRLLVHSISIDSDTLLTDTVYLADFRFGNNEDDYILDEWVEAKIDYSHKLGFELQSSDNGEFGMNTPAYFSLSIIQRVPASISEQVDEVNVVLYPNPTKGTLNLEVGSIIEKIVLLNTQGQEVLIHRVGRKSAQLNLLGLTPGIYIVQITTEGGVANKKIIKQ